MERRDFFSLMAGGAGAGLLGAAGAGSPPARANWGMVAPGPVPPAGFDGRLLVNKDRAYEVMEREGLDGIVALNPLNVFYLGNYIGEFLGELCLGVFFLLTGLSMLSEPRNARWVGFAGVAFAILFLIGSLRNVLPPVQTVADITNALLPLWMVVLGTYLVWSSRGAFPHGDA